MLKIFLMTKNEINFVEDWIKYHGYLFGLDNIFILDGSDDLEVLDIYEKYKKHGLNICFSDSGLNDLSKELTLLMHEHKGRDNFLIKMDTDEFLAYTNPFIIHNSSFFSKYFVKGYLKCQKRSRGGFFEKLYENYFDKRNAHKTILTDNIREMFACLPVTGQKYKASLTTWSVPVSKAYEMPCRSHDLFTPLQFTHLKSFFHSSNFVSVDLGCHSGVTSINKGCIDTGLTLIHFHSTSLEESAVRAKKVLLSHGYIDENDCLEDQVNKLSIINEKGVSDSIHKIKFYLKYLEYNNENNPFDLESLNEQHPFFRKTGEPIKMTVVKDVLDNVDRENKYV